MFCRKQISVAIAASMLVSMPVSANVGTGMNSLFNSMGGYANATPPSSYKSQTQNNFSGGGLYVRTPVKPVPPFVTISPPSMNIGCNGIDLTAGSFSFINKAALTGMFQNIGTSLSYAFLLAIKSSMPEMSSLFEYLQDQANKVNQASINACQLTNGIPFVSGDSLSNNLSAMKTHIQGALQNTYSDSNESRTATKDDAAARKAVEDAAVAADPSKEELFRPGNVVWRVLSRRTGMDVEDKEFIMSMTGTIIITQPSGSGGGSLSAKWEYKPPKIHSIDDLVGPVDPSAPATVGVYKCATTAANGCLSMTESNLNITSFTKRVSDKIDTLRAHVTGRTPHTTASIGDFQLVDASNIPIWKMITATSDVSPDLVNSYKRMVAVDVAYAYVEGVLIQARQIMLSGSQEAQSDDAKNALEKLTVNLKVLQENLQSQRLAESANVQKTVEIERQLQLVAQAMNAGIPAQAFTSMQVFK